MKQWPNVAYSLSMDELTAWNRLTNTFRTYALFVVCVIAGFAAPAFATQSQLFKGNSLSVEVFEFKSSLPAPARTPAKKETDYASGVYGLGVAQAWEYLASNHPSALPYLLGKGVKMANFELSHFGHFNLPDPIGVIPRGMELTKCLERLDHGTGTQGILSARPYDRGDLNREGTLGIVPNARYYLTDYLRIRDIKSDCERVYDPNFSYDTGAFAALAERMSPGDVISASLGLSSNKEFRVLARDLTEKKGVIVLIAAGNENVDISSTDCVNFSSRDTDPILVGGSQSDSNERFGVMSNRGSSYGSCVSLFSWYDGYDSLRVTGGDKGKWPRTTGWFGGTSGATPLVAGTVLAVQGLAKHWLGRALSPRELRDLLEKTGSRSANPSIDRIGVQPNLLAAVKQLELMRGSICIPGGAGSGLRTQVCGGPIGLPDDNDNYFDLAYPNPQLPDPTALQPNPPPVNVCTGTTLGWPDRNAGACFGSVPTRNNGEGVWASANSPNSGSAFFSCENGSWKSPEGSTCSTPPRPNMCPATTKSWSSPSGNNCSGTLAETSPGSSRTASDTDNGATGWASYQCLYDVDNRNNGSPYWADKPHEGTCSAPAPSCAQSTQNQEPVKPNNWGLIPSDYIVPGPSTFDSFAKKYYAQAVAYTTADTNIFQLKLAVLHGRRSFWGGNNNHRVQLSPLGPVDRIDDPEGRYKSYSLIDMSGTKAEVWRFWRDAYAYVSNPPFNSDFYENKGFEWTWNPNKQAQYVEKCGYARGAFDALSSPVFVTAQIPITRATGVQTVRVEVDNVMIDIDIRISPSTNGISFTEIAEHSHVASGRRYYRSSDLDAGALTLPEGGAFELNKRKFAIYKAIGNDNFEHQSRAVALLRCHEKLSFWPLTSDCVRLGFVFPMNGVARLINRDPAFRLQNEQAFASGTGVAMRDAMFAQMNFPTHVLHSTKYPGDFVNIYNNYVSEGTTQLAAIDLFAADTANYLIFPAMYRSLVIPNKPPEPRSPPPIFEPNPLSLYPRLLPIAGCDNPAVMRPNCFAVESLDEAKARYAREIAIILQTLDDDE